MIAKQTEMNTCRRLGKWIEGQVWHVQVSVYHTSSPMEMSTLQTMGLRTVAFENWDTLVNVASLFVFNFSI